VELARALFSVLAFIHGKLQLDGCLRLFRDMINSTSLEQIVLCLDRGPQWRHPAQAWAHIRRQGRLPPLNTCGQTQDTSSGLIGIRKTKHEVTTTG
jgi:hypothetical protein